MASPNVAALILAAGQGKRMLSKLPKVLHPVGELPMVAHVVRLALSRGASPIVVVVDPVGGAEVEKTLRGLMPDAPLRFAVQHKAQGTGDAARVGVEALGAFDGRVLILYGDVPLLTEATVAGLQEAQGTASLAMLTAELPDATGYGRILRDGTKVTGGVIGIVEHKDATEAQRAIREINVGVYAFDAALLARGVKGLTNNNAQGEYYLTDLVPLAAQAAGVVGVVVRDMTEVRGVNTRVELGEAEGVLKRRLVTRHQERGVTFRDPTSVYVGVDVTLAADVTIGVGVQLYGKTRVEAGARIEGPSVIRDAVILAGAEVESFSHVEGAEVGPGAHVGPMARLRTGAILEEGARVGNFVELKKTRLGKGAKANHLAYLGDAQIGPGANIGAGTITCNYDGGPKKHATEVGAGAFVGSNSTLVAPVKIGAAAYVAAGSTVTKDVPADALAFGRARQQNREGYAAILREKTGAGAGKKS